MRHRSASAAKTAGDDSKEPLVTSAENIQLREVQFVQVSKVSGPTL